MYEPRKSNKRPGSSFDPHIIDEKCQAAIEDVENFISNIMNMQWRSYTVRASLIESSKDAAPFITALEHPPQRP